MRVLPLCAQPLRAPRALFAHRPRLASFRPSRACRRALSLRVQAVRAYPDPDFIAEVKASFPEKGVADVEEARVLFSACGYAFLDVRTEVEQEDAGRVRGSVSIPLMHARREWSPEEQRKVVTQEPNRRWLEEVQEQFPDPATPIMVACADGKEFSIDALIALDEAGYSSLVGLRGGYAAWSKVWDNKLNRRGPAPEAASSWQAGEEQEEAQPAEVVEAQQEEQGNWAAAEEEEREQQAQQAQQEAQWQREEEEAAAAQQEVQEQQAQASFEQQLAEEQRRAYLAAAAAATAPDLAAPAPAPDADAAAAPPPAAPAPRASSPVREEMSQLRQSAQELSGVLGELEAQVAERPRRGRPDQSLDHRTPELEAAMASRDGYDSDGYWSDGSGSGPSPPPQQQEQRQQEEAQRQQQERGGRGRAARQWPDPDFIERTLEAFPGRGVANAEEAMVLLCEDDYAYLDVRPELEAQVVGRVAGSINVPMATAWQEYSEEDGREVVFTEPNPDWLEQVEAAFPDKETPLLVGCSNGKRYAIDALVQLYQNGYSNLVGLKGGYNTFSKSFDDSLTRRNPGDTGPSQELKEEFLLAREAPPPPAEEEPAEGPSAAAQRTQQALQAQREEEAAQQGSFQLNGSGRAQGPEAVESSRAALERALERSGAGAAGQQPVNGEAWEGVTPDQQAVLDAQLRGSAALASARAALAACKAEVEELEENLAALWKQAELLSGTQQQQHQQRRR